MTRTLPTLRSCCLALVMLSVHAVTTSAASSSPFLRNHTSFVNIQIPTSLHSNSGYPHSLAKFGTHFDFFAQSGTLTTQLIYDSRYSKLCHEPDSHERRTFPHPFMLLVGRGNCTFVQKVRRAQQLGASGVIIANQYCLCDEPNCQDNDEPDAPEKCEHHLPIVADDGSGSDVSIPSVVIQKTDGNAIKNALQHHLVLAEISWHMPKYESKTKLDVFHSVASMSSMSFLTNFSTLATSMKDQLDLNIHYDILDGTALGCKGKASQKDDACFDLCTNNGRYCATTSHHGISGKNIVIESLRRMCIQEHDAKDNLEHYWEYLSHFTSWCQSSDFFGNDDCINDAYKHSKIDKEIIEACIKDSGDITQDDTNSWLEQAIVTNTEYGVLKTPSIFVNGLPMKYTISPRVVLDALCMSYDTGLGPHVCFACAQCGDPVLCASRNPMQCHADDGKEKEKPKNNETPQKKKKRHTLRWLFILALFGSAGGYIYYKKFVDDGEGGAYSLTEAFMSDDTA